MWWQWLLELLGLALIFAMLWLFWPPSTLGAMGLLLIFVANRRRG